MSYCCLHNFRHSFLVTLISALTVTTVLPSAAQVNILTNKMDNARDGQNTNETLLTSAVLNTNSFGKLFAFNVDGYVQAQPLYMSGFNINGVTQNVVFVATMNNSVYAINADTGVQLWQVNLGPTVPSSVEGCGGVTGTGFSGIGILSTPVIDPSSNTIYVTAKTYVNNVAAYSLHALSLTTGQEQVAMGSPVTITATSGSLTFSPLLQIQRPGILESNGTIYLGFGSNGCDLKARGWLMAYNASNLSQLAVMVTQPDEAWGSSLWNGGVGPAADSNGNVYTSTANGEFNYSAFDLGDSVLKLSLGGNSFNVEDYFTPYDQANMGANDIDLGSGQVVLLPYQIGSNTPDLLVTSGKDADIYLISTDDLGQYNPAGNTQIPAYLPNALGGEFFGAPVYWNNNIYFLAHLDYLRSFTLGVSGGVSTLVPNKTTSGKLTTIGLPVVSANGNTNGILWLVRSVSNVPRLSAYDANQLLLLYDSGMAAGGRDTLGTVGHFATPIVANGKVYAGTTTQLVVYGLFPQVNATAGNNQQGYTGQTLPTPITVTAVNPYTGAPIQGVTVTFSDNGANGTFSNPTGVTNSSGQASSTYTLPTTPKTVTITVSSPGYASATFTEMDQAGPVASLALVSGSKQTGVVGSTLPAPIIIRAKDINGNLITGASISFNDGNLGGTFSPNPAVTGSNGQASTTYTLPIVAGTITVTASAGTVTTTAKESSTAGPATMVLVIQGNNQTAHVNNRLAKALIVSVTDQYGNGINGLTVNFTDNGAGGTFSNASPVTNTKGQATTNYTTGPNTGTVTIDATYSTLSPAVFTETVD